jgi:hypothetical protein
VEGTEASNRRLHRPRSPRWQARLQATRNRLGETVEASRINSQSSIRTFQAASAFEMSEWRYTFRSILESTLPNDTRIHPHGLFLRLYSTRFSHQIRCC